jgi:hypothetical protein
MLKTSSALVSALPALALSLLSLLQPRTAVAGTIFFNDSSPTGAFFTTDVPARVSGGCIGGLTEVCTVTLLPFPLSTNASWASEDIYEMLPGILTTISDTVKVSPNQDAGFNILSFNIVFTSGDNLPTVGGNFIREDGTVQTATAINWFSNGALIATDVIQFQSTDAPEPAALVLTGCGLIGLGFCRRRRRNTRLCH